MNINSVFPSKYLKADEITEDRIVTIKSVEIEDIGSGEKKDSKPIIYFREGDKGVVCNKTNANTIADMYGPETDSWIGKRITLFAQEVDFQGKQVLATRVRVRPPVTTSPNQTNAAVDPSIAAAKGRAWLQWSKGKAEGASALSDGLNKAIQLYYGTVPAMLTAKMWDEMAANNFVKPAPEQPFGDEVQFKEEEVPF